MKTITITTPTYNRAYVITSLYESLCRQTLNDFCWLVVDDGSTDNTETLIKSFINEAKIEIKYLKQKNSGKHVALMTAIANIETELYLCVDSDDYLTDDAVEKIIQNYYEYKDEKILGFYFRQINKRGLLMGSAYPANIDRCGITDLYDIYGYSGETAIVLKTELIKQYKFPVFEGEKFVSEKYFYVQLNCIAPMILKEDVIYVSDYLEDGYTKNSNRLIYNNPYGVAYGCLSECRYNPRFIVRLKNYAMYRGILITFKIDKTKLKEYNKTTLIEKMISIMFVPHYIKLLRGIIKTNAQL